MTHLVDRPRDRKTDAWKTARQSDGGVGGGSIDTEGIGWKGERANNGHGMLLFR